MADEKIKTTKKSRKKKEEKRRLVVIRVRGKVHLRSDISDTMKLMNLTRINHCVIVDNRAQYTGMINKAKDYITWGEINTKIINKLLSKRGMLTGNKKLTDDYISKNKNINYNSVAELSTAV